MWRRPGRTLVARYWRVAAKKPVADSPSAPAIALRTAITTAIHFLIPLGSIFCLLITLYVDDANIRIFSNIGIFFQACGVARGVARGLRVGEAPAGGWGAWERGRRPPPAPCVDGSGRRVRGSAWQCFTWNIRVTGSLSARYSPTQPPRLLQTYRNYPSNTLLG